MSTTITEQTLNAILALQLTVAWAGEGRCKPKRFGWWDTDLIDENGGGDFLSQLAPRTYAWAGLALAREAARRVDAKARSRHGDADALRSIYFLGFEIDEKPRGVEAKRSCSSRGSLFRVRARCTFSGAEGRRGALRPGEGELRKGAARGPRAWRARARRA
jgi:hypothetical protein